MDTVIRGMLADIHLQAIYPAQISIENRKIKSIERIERSDGKFILPGFIDSHIHVESSLLSPENFSEVVVGHGTVATVSDPHEIANVCGLDGVDFMIQNGKKGHIKFFWTAPSCVPTTSFETSGAVLGDREVGLLLQNINIVALGEMMDYPGVISQHPEVLKKIRISLLNNKPVDGHAPGLGGDELLVYVGAGISTDHECSSVEEAREKIKLGMKILIREGSSARNFDSLISLLTEAPDAVMLCSDDLHADDLMRGHINKIVKRALRKGVPLFNILRAVSSNPVDHYKLPLGLLRVGDPADFIIIDNLVDFNISQTWINGECVFKSGQSLNQREYVPGNLVNNFNTQPVTETDFRVKCPTPKIRAITVENGSLLTGSEILEVGDNLQDFLKDNDILMLYVKGRYKNSLPAKAFLKGFGPMKGAIASTIAHDSHNIIAIGDNLRDVSNAINLLIENKGGIAFVKNEISEVLPLPIGGLMSDKPAAFVADKYKRIINLVHQHGCILESPLMTLSFLALPVIPSLKLTDKGLFDVEKFGFTDLFVE